MSKTKLIKKLLQESEFHLKCGDVYIIKKTGLYSLYNADGIKILPDDYKQIYRPFKDFPNHFKLVDIDDKVWIADGMGKILTSRGYHAIGISCLDYYRFTNETWNGFIEIDDDKDGSGYFDFTTEKEVIVPIPGQRVRDINEIQGIYSYGIPVFQNIDGKNRCKLVNSKGDDLIPYERGFEDFGEVFSPDEEYLILALKGEKWGYVNIDGVEKIPCKYDVASDFVDKMAIVGYVGQSLYELRLGVIGHHDKVLVPMCYREILGRPFIIDGRVFVYASRIGDDEYHIYRDDGVMFELDKLPENPYIIHRPYWHYKKWSSL